MLKVDFIASISIGVVKSDISTLSKSSHIIMPSSGGGCIVMLVYNSFYCLDDKF